MAARTSRKLNKLLPGVGGLEFKFQEVPAGAELKKLQKDLKAGIEKVLEKHGADPRPKNEKMKRAGAAGPELQRRRAKGKADRKGKEAARQKNDKEADEKKKKAAAEEAPYEDQPLALWEQQAKGQKVDVVQYLEALGKEE